MNPVCPLISPLRVLEHLYVFDLIYSFTAECSSPGKVAVLHLYLSDPQDETWASFLMVTLTLAELGDLRHCRRDILSSFLGAEGGCYLVWANPHRRAAEVAVLASPGEFDPAPLLPEPGVFMYAHPPEPTP